MRVRNIVVVMSVSVDELEELDTLASSEFISNWSQPTQASALHFAPLTTLGRTTAPTTTASRKKERPMFPDGCRDILKTSVLPYERTSERATEQRQRRKKERNNSAPTVAGSPEPSSTPHDGREALQTPRRSRLGCAFAFCNVHSRTAQASRQRASFCQQSHFRSVSTGIFSACTAPKCVVRKTGQSSAGLRVLV